MALETGTYIDALNVNNPASTDGLGQADDHMRLIKSTIKSTFPSITGAVSSTQGELNIVDGDTTRVAATLVDGDGVVVNDGGTMKQVLASSVKTYMGVPTSITDLGITDGSAGNYLVTDGSGNFSFDVPVSGLSFNTSNGVLTATRGGGLGNLTVDLDGRFLTDHPNISAASSDNNSGSTFVQDVILDSNGHVTGLTSVDVESSISGIKLKDITSGNVTNNVITPQTLSAGTYLVRIKCSSTAASQATLNLPTTNVEAGWGNGYGINQFYPVNTQVAFNGTNWVDNNNLTKTSITVGTNHTTSGGSIELWIKLSGTTTITTTNTSPNNKLLIVKTD